MPYRQDMVPEPLPSDAILKDEMWEIEDLKRMKKMNSLMMCSLKMTMKKQRKARESQMMRILILR